MRLTFVYCMACLAVIAFLGWGMFGAATDPEYQAGLTARKQAAEQTKRGQAQEWGNTVRGTVPWLAGGVGVGLVVWGAVKWQEQRTRRHEVTEEQTTARHLITAKKDIVLAYLAQCPEVGAREMVLGGVRGVYLPSSNEWVPEEICRRELAERRMITMEVDA